MRLDNYWKKQGLMILIVLKSFWKASVEIVWGVAGMVLLGGFILEYLPESNTIYELQRLTGFLIDNLFYFWAVILLLFLYDNWWRVRELNYSEDANSELNGGKKK